MSEHDPIPNLEQGDPALLHTPVAQRLLHARIPARLAYIGPDGTPRAIPINSVWTGDELVMGSFAANHKVAALRQRPAVAVCIDTIDGAVEALLLRGIVSLADVEGLVPEYAARHRRPTWLPSTSRD